MRSGDSKSGEAVVVTVVRVPDEAARGELLKQCQQLIGQAHVNIIRLRDAGAEGYVFWLVHDSFDGLRLDQLQADATASPETRISRCLDILNQVAAGLAFLHGSGFVHAQLRPANVLVAADGGVRISCSSPVALCARCDESSLFQSELAAFEASPYAAPEIAQGGRPSCEGDCFAFGVIAYELMAGSTPRGRFKSLASRVPLLPRAFARSVEQCLESHPAERPSSAQLVRANAGGDGTSALLSLIGHWTRRTRAKTHSANADSVEKAVGDGARAENIATDALSLGIFGLLVGHVVGAAIGTAAVFLGSSASLGIGLHHIMLAACGLVGSVSGLWREQALSVIKNGVLGRDTVRVFEAAARYVDPEQRARDALKHVNAAGAMDELSLPELRDLLATTDAAVEGLKRAVISDTALPPVHGDLVEASHRLLSHAAEKALKARQYGVARELYRRLAVALPADTAVATHATQLEELLANHTSRIERLLAAGRLAEASQRLRSLAKHFPQDETIQELRRRCEAKCLALQSATSVPLQALVREGRWRRIGEIIDLLAEHSLPLGNFASVVDENHKRQSAFARESESALVAIEKLGVRGAQSYQARLASIIADHPFLAQLERDITLVRNAYEHAKAEARVLGKAGRAIGEENTLRSFLLCHRIGSVSVLDAAQQLAEPVEREWARWRLLLWYIFGGVVFVVCQLVFPKNSLSRDALGLARGLPLPEEWQTIVGVAAIAGLQYLAVGVLIFVMLTIVSRRSVALVSLFIGLALAVAVACAVPPAWAVYLSTATSQPPRIVTSTVEMIPSAVNVIARLWLFTAAAGVVCGACSWAPSLTVAAVSVASLLGIQQTAEWCDLLPEAFLAAAVLVTAGVVRTPRAWLCFPCASIVAAMLVARTAGPVNASVVSQLAPPLIALSIGGILALRRVNMRSYVWLAVSVAISVFGCWWLRGRSSAGDIFAHAALWAIACSGTAMYCRPALGGAICLWDVFTSYRLRMQSSGTPVGGRSLIGSSWYETNRKWHAKHGSGNTPTPAESTSKVIPRV